MEEVQVGRWWVRAYVRPLSRGYDLYGSAYREALRCGAATLGGRYDEVALGRLPSLLRVFRRARDAYLFERALRQAGWLASGLDRVAGLVEGRIAAPAGAFARLVSQLVITDAGGRSWKVCIDAADFGQVMSPSLCAWSDVYFKTNYWPSLPYPANVAPLCNVDPLVLPHLETFRAHRERKKKYDLGFIVRVWGGRNETDGVEHNLRLLEAMAQAPGSKFLHAYLVAGDIHASARRLDRSGIPWSVRPLPARRLWEVSAQSRLNVVRLGIHDCVPWRMTGALALGSCIVLDRPPHTQWPTPLIAGENFLELGTGTEDGRSLARDEQYAAIPARVAAWLADEGSCERIGRNNAVYFDRNLEPARLGVSLLETIGRLGRAHGPGSPGRVRAGERADAPR